jgi:hypothetical protein
VADPAIVSDWLTLLAGLNGYGLDKQEVELRLSILAPALAEELPVEVFTPETVRAVAKKHLRYFPGFGEIYEVLEPLARAVREDRRLRIEYSGRSPAIESQEPYVLPPAPEWCFERKPRLLGRPSPEEIAELVQSPVRSPAQQYAELTGCPLAEAEAKFGSTMVDA